jgi:hypothetical protein
MGATAELTLSSTVSGLREGGIDLMSLSFSHTSAANTVTLMTLTTLVGTATPVVVPSSGQFIIALPADSTNGNQWVVTPSTAQAGATISSNGFFAARVPGGSTFYFYAAGGASTFALRVITY